MKTTNRFSLLVSLALLIGLLFAISRPARATPTPLSQEQAEGLVSSLHFQEGVINLHDGLATLRVPAGFHFLNGADANTVLVKIWGNPPQGPPLGMLMPRETSPLSEECWAVIITYEGDGYVKDTDAEKIDYSELLSEMQKRVTADNEEREKAGYPPIQLVGWAQTPHYDRSTHKLYWAKEIKFGHNSENTLNYNIRMLGRGGVLVLNAVASMSQLPQINRATPEVLSAIEFNPGHRYADFNPSSDKVAEYGLAALVAGGVAAKMGLFKGLWVALLGAKKLVIVGVVAIAAWFRKIFKRNAPATQPQNNESVSPQ